MKTITGKINLASLPHVILQKKGQTGMVVGIFIPIQKAHLFKSEKGAVYLDIIAFEVADKKYDDTHIIKQSLSKETRSKMSEEEQKSMPILGNLNTNFGGSGSANNNAAPGKTFTESPDEDDLPF